ncbi:MAG: hypothetical protein OXD32_07190 [Endozoicomonadaceae bacterium]|nr:hypothetical protein [Endozoicomonadaceae bacterium]MCY4330195.1 hypothetical protein [Endozoicomonadaceae bacterium]
MINIRVFVQYLTISSFIVFCMLINVAMAKTSQSSHAGNWSGEFIMNYNPSDTPSLHPSCKCDITVKITKNNQAVFKLFNPRSGSSLTRRDDCLYLLGTHLCDGKTFTKKIKQDGNCMNISIAHNESTLPARFLTCMQDDGSLYGTLFIHNIFESILLRRTK